MTAPSTLAPASLHASFARQFDAAFRARREDAARYGALHGRLWQHAEQTCSAGKRIRPHLLLDAYCEMVGDPDGQPAADAPVQVAVAVELLHAAFLLHDDVLDGDLRRRGMPNLVARMRDDAGSAGGAPGSVRHWGMTGGVLMGDLLLTEAMLTVARADVGIEARSALLALVEHAIVESVAGELMDVAFSDGLAAPDLVEVLGASTHKTAAYSFELPLRAAGVLAGVDRRADEQLGRVGRALGRAFQLQDDLLSTFGQADLHGKDAFSDLRGGKQTAIIAAARTTGDWPQIEALLSAPAHLTESHAERLSRLLERCGARAFVEALVDDAVTAVRATLEEAEGHALPVAVLATLIDRLDGRVT